VSNLMPYYGTKIFEQCVRDNLLVNTLHLDELWLGNKFYLASKDFFVKPYNLEVEDLYDFREKCNEYILKNKRQHEKRRIRN
jgi:anaerobic magnesium-protoporphyrin IX monomethyl ester cyclase